MKPEFGRHSTCSSNRASAYRSAAVTLLIGCAPPAATSIAESQPVEKSLRSERRIVIARAGIAPVTNRLVAGVSRRSAVRRRGDSSLADEPAVMWKKSFKDGCSNPRPRSSMAWSTSAGSTATFTGLDLATARQKWQFHSELGFQGAGGRARRAGLHRRRRRQFRLPGRGHGEAEMGACRPTPRSTPAPTSIRDNVLIGSQDGSLYALDAKTGKQWKYTIDNMIQCSPTIVEDRVFIAGCDSKLAHHRTSRPGERVGSRSTSRIPRARRRRPWATWSISARRAPGSSASIGARRKLLGLRAAKKKSAVSVFGRGVRTACWSLAGAIGCSWPGRRQRGRAVDISHPAECRRVRP